MPIARTLSVLLIALCCSAGAEERALRRSDIVFFIDDPAQYQAYGCTVVGWGAQAKADHIKAAHEAGVRLLATSVPFRTAFNKVIDYSDQYLDAACRDFSGEPFAVPWLWDHKYKDQPYWWGCTNSPLFQEWLEHYLDPLMAAEPDGLHIDDYTGTAGSVTWLSGGFCTHCMQAFRAYLKEKTPQEKLLELGITDLETFDYRQFLLDRGVKPEEYNAKRGSLPLAAEFLDFQAHAVTDFVRRFHEQACKLRGRRVTLSVNSGLESPMSLMIAPYVDFFCCEVGHVASKGGWPEHPVYIYKLADALDRPVAAMASGQDHAFIAEHNAKELLRTWVVTAYTHGQAFTPPTNLWCYTKEKGTHWYKGAQEDYAWLYRFVRDNAALFDGYIPVAPVAVVYDNAARRAGKGNIEPLCAALDKANVPFAMLAAGDDWLDYQLTAEKLAPFKTLIVAEPPERMDAAQRALLENTGRMVVYNDALPAQLPRITVENGLDIAAVLRVTPSNPDAPLVCHVHSRVYDSAQDRVIPQENPVLHIPRAILPGRPYANATLLTPGAGSQSIPLESTDTEIILRLPQTGLWGLVAIS